MSNPDPAHAENLSSRETRIRLVYLEQVVDQLMCIIGMTGTPEQLTALDVMDNKWIQALKDEGLT